MRRELRFRPRAWGVCTFAFVVLAGAVSWAGSSRAAAPDPVRADLEKRFTGTVRPFIQTYCASCHTADKPQAQFDVSGWTVEPVARSRQKEQRFGRRVLAERAPALKRRKSPSGPKEQPVVD